MDERNLTGRAPWWFRKLVEAETAEYAERRKADPMFGRRPLNGAYPVTPKYEGEELSLVEKLAKYSIVREPGDEQKSAALAQARVTPAARAALPPEVPEAEVPEGYLRRWEDERETGF